jgi:hypothetical protein
VQRQIKAQLQRRQTQAVVETEVGVAKPNHARTGAGLASEDRQGAEVGLAAAKQEDTFAREQLDGRLAQRDVAGASQLSLACGVPCAQEQQRQGSPDGLPADGVCRVQPHSNGCTAGGAWRCCRENGQAQHEKDGCCDGKQQGWGRVASGGARLDHRHNGANVSAIGTDVAGRMCDKTGREETKGFNSEGGEAVKVFVTSGSHGAFLLQRSVQQDVIQTWRSMIEQCA